MLTVVSSQTHAQESQRASPQRLFEIDFPALRVQPIAEATGLWLECKLNRPAVYGNLETLDTKATQIYMYIF